MASSSLFHHYPLRKRTFSSQSFSSFSTHPSSCDTQLSTFSLPPEKTIRRKACDLEERGEIVWDYKDTKPHIPKNSASSLESSTPKLKLTEITKTISPSFHSSACTFPLVELWMQTSAPSPAFRPRRSPRTPKAKAKRPSQSNTALLAELQQLIATTKENDCVQDFGLLLGDPTSEPCDESMSSDVLDFLDQVEAAFPSSPQERSRSSYGSVGPIKSTPLRTPRVPPELSTPRTPLSPKKQPSLMAGPKNAPLEATKCSSEEIEKKKMQALLRRKKAEALRKRDLRLQRASSIIPSS